MSQYPFETPAIATVLDYAVTNTVRAGIANGCVQGPPGTGKTACIVAMVSALLLESGSDGASLHSSTAGSSASHRRVLLCAQSNAACDEMVFRLSQQVCSSDRMYQCIALFYLYTNVRRAAVALAVEAP